LIDRVSPFERDFIAGLYYNFNVAEAGRAGPTTSAAIKTAVSGAATSFC
jgi:hypothetical protein